MPALNSSDSSDIQYVAEPMPWTNHPHTSVLKGRYDEEVRIWVEGAYDLDPYT